MCAFSLQSHTNVGLKVDLNSNPTTFSDYYGVRISTHSAGQLHEFSAVLLALALASSVALLVLVRCVGSLGRRGWLHL